MDIKIRMLSFDDITQVIAISSEIREYHRNMLNGYFTPQDDEMEKEGFLYCLESDSKDFCLVAEINNEVLGLALVETKHTPYLEKSNVCTIRNFGVLEKVRKHGIGKILMEKVVEECHKRSILEVKLGVFNANKTAYKFYEDMGFEPQEQKMSLML